MPRKWLILVFLLSLLAFVVIRILPKIKTKTSFIEVADMEEKKPKKVKEEENFQPPTLLVDLLDKSYGEKSFSIGRNIFRYGPPKIAQQPQIPTKLPGREVAGIPPRVPSEPLATETQSPSSHIEREQKIQPPPFTYKYLGFFGPQDKKLAVFYDGKEIMDLFEGETIENKFIVKKIGFESVTIGFIGFPDDITQKIEVGP